MKYTKLIFLGILMIFSGLAQGQTVEQEQSLEKEQSATQELSMEEEIKQLKKQARLSYNEGVRLAISGKMEEAHMKFDSAILSYPDFDLPYLERGKIKLLVNEIDLALNDIAKAIEINNMLGEAFYVRAYIKMLMKDYQNALTDFTHAIQKGYIEAFIGVDFTHESYHGKIYGLA